MAFKINIAHKGKTYKLESSSPSLIGHSIGEKLKGDLVSEDLNGYELQITGTSDKSGFAGLESLEGPNLKKVLLGYGVGMHKRPKGDKKVNKKPLGLRLRKTVRGKEISESTVQINTKVLSEGSKKFDSFFEKPSEENAPEKSE